MASRLSDAEARDLLTMLLRHLGTLPEDDNQAVVRAQIIAEAKSISELLAPSKPPQWSLRFPQSPDLPKRSSIDSEAIGRILNVTGRDLVRPSANGTGEVSPERVKEEFRRSIVQSIGSYSAIIQNAHIKPTKDRLALLNSALTAAKELDAVLKLCQSRGFEINHSARDVVEAVEEIQCLILQGNVVKNHPSGSRRASRRSPSPFDRLAGDYLSKNFEEYFGSAPTLSRDSNQTPNSPYVRFVDAVLAEFGVMNLGKPYSREAIVKALSDARKRSRQRDRAKLVHRSPES